MAVHGSSAEQPTLKTTHTFIRRGRETQTAAQPHTRMLPNHKKKHTAELYDDMGLFLYRSVRGVPSHALRNSREAGDQEPPFPSCWPFRGGCPSLWESEAPWSYSLGSDFPAAAPRLLPLTFWLMSSCLHTAARVPQAGPTPLPSPGESVCVRTRRETNTEPRLCSPSDLSHTPPAHFLGAPPPARSPGGHTSHRRGAPTAGELCSLPVGTETQPHAQARPPEAPAKHPDLTVRQEVQASCWQVWCGSPDTVRVAAVATAALGSRTPETVLTARPQPPESR